MEGPLSVLTLEHREEPASGAQDLIATTETSGQRGPCTAAPAAAPAAPAAALE